MDFLEAIYQMSCYQRKIFISVMKNLAAPFKYVGGMTLLITYFHETDNTVRQSQGTISILWDCFHVMVFYF